MTANATEVEIRSHMDITPMVGFPLHVNNRCDAEAAATRHKVERTQTK